ncbi:MFS transporter [Paludibacterium paludis]|uniref:MFS transporter n=1 Tax=Paludibacterium paludis TaxID=1225769 RepID=UPI001E601845|nr:MFS transporter [Paludibacterium paludis]
MTLTFIALGVFLALSEAIYDLAFANMAYTITGKTLSVTTTYAVGYGAEILVTLLGAGFIDRFNKWRLFLATQAANIIVFALAAVLLSRENPTVATVWFFAFFVDLIHQYSRLIVFALVPFLFAKDEIPRLNGMLAVCNGVAKALGPVVGAIAILYVGLPASLLGSIAFMVGALVLTMALGVMSQASTIPAIVSVPEERFRDRLQESVFGASRAAYQLLALPRWRWFLASYSSCVLVIGVLALLWIPLLRSFHGFSDAETGYLMSTGTFGAVIGGSMLRRHAQLSKLTSVLRAAHFVMAFGIFVAFVVRGNPYVVGIGMFAFHVGTTMYFRSTASAIQTNIPKDVIGSWYGAIDFISRFVGLAGILFAGWAFDAIGPYALYTALLVLLLVSVLNWRGSNHALESAPV